ncbi:MAG TPA: hypothetical protein PLD20_14635 [Blastocatellia bacterium]|nr:hypothetical protein [Blastocatellia bacterium]HMX30108.1 hypothetical protein [Blastocatellia bacterium]HMY74801.1 hypothetical protein [Blastocatellia bacterium]HMZ19168.1 hypothetical protein [Blastocatellia bacterium]HNG28956.1 hypothetical protein [Blastocatellia bacterium]
MSAITMTLPIDTELASWLAQKAAVQGINIEEVALETLRRQAGKPSMNEIFAEVQAEFEAGGMTDEELGQVIEQALIEARAANP